MSGRARTLRRAAVLAVLGLAVHLVLPRIANPAGVAGRT